MYLQKIHIYFNNIDMSATFFTLNLYKEYSYLKLSDLEELPRF